MIGKEKVVSQRAALKAAVQPVVELGHYSGPAEEFKCKALYSIAASLLAIASCMIEGRQ